MNLTDYILVSRNNILYKAKITALSGLYCFKFARDQLSAYLTNISTGVDDSAEVYSDSHYTKSEIKEDFCTISSVNNLTANAKYVPIETAENATSSLLTRENIDSWQKIQTDYCINIMSEEFQGIHDIMKQSTPEEGHMVDYANPIKDINEANQYIIDSNQGTDNYGEYETGEDD